MLLDHAPLAAAGSIEIRIGDSGQVILRLPAPNANGGYVIGRSDDTSDYIPDIDLAQIKPRPKSVSRRHAALVGYHDTIHLIDLKSINGTYVNEERLTAEKPYPLNTGDKLRLGTLNLYISSIKP